jgi:hypothetical protein
LGSHSLKWAVEVVFIATNQIVAVGKAAGDRRTGQSGAPPCHPTVRVLEQLTVGGFVFEWHRTVRCHTGHHCPLSGAPLTGGFDSARTILHCSLHQSLLQSTVAPSSRCSAGTPDSPVNYSGACHEKPESG